MTPATGSAVGPNPLESRIEAALDRIRPAIRRDGGDVWLIKVEDGVAYVQMIGACGGCAAVLSTLKGGIEAVVREAVPEIRAVEQI
jgi:Fe-S cluster biogenesis protein NfuA